MPLSAITLLDKFCCKLCDKKEKITKKFTFYILRLLHLIMSLGNKPNFEFGATFILWHFSNYALKMPKTEP